MKRVVGVMLLVGRVTRWAALAGAVIVFAVLLALVGRLVGVLSGDDAAAYLLAVLLGLATVGPVCYTIGWGDAVDDRLRRRIEAEIADAEQARR